MRGVECSYAVSKEPTPEYNSVIPWQPSNQRPAGATAECFRPARQVPDALLWQYYLSYAGGTLAATGSDRAYAEMWQTCVPAVAHSDPGTSHALMALSALCLISNEPDLHGTALDYHSTAMHHYTASVRLLRESISVPEKAAADALLACSMLLIPCGIAFARKTASPTSEWLHHLRGFRALGDALNESDGIANAEHQLIPFPQDGIPEQQIHIVSRGRHSKATLLCNLIRCSRHRALDKLRAAVAASDPASDPLDTEAYVLAIEQLQYVMDYVVECRTSNYLRAIFSWSTQVSPRFVMLLGSRDELAIAIGVHWIVLTLLLHDLWFVKGFGAFRIETVTARFEQSRSINLWLLDWPREVLRQWLLFE
ncbi:transcription factor [Elasticomyces elasticus]|nr:transcription factor [Elasticomyces elasticus]KAK4967131.1 transcription factor [Elasticomyces elasticus]KAK5728585.1 transcription factor [Elasticomyces elasticus]